MKVIICGDREWANYRCSRCNVSLWPCPECTTVNRRLNGAILREMKAASLEPHKDIVIEGDARGADKIAGQWAETLGFKRGESLLVVAAEWGKFGRAAGPIRNRAMLALDPDEVWAFHRDIKASKGTRHMVEIAQAKGTLVKVFES